MQWLKSVVVSVVSIAMSAGAASAQTQVKPRVLLIVDTSGSMAWELTSNASTGADGSGLYRSPMSWEVPDFGRGYATTEDSCSVSTYRGLNSRMYAAKTAVSQVVNASGDVDWGLARYSGSYCDIQDHPVDQCGGNNECIAASSCCRASAGQTGNCTNSGTGLRACRCTSNTDCGVGQQCATVPGRSHTTCVQVDPFLVTCGNDSDCTSDDCNGGRCACTAHGQCGVNQFCVSGFCRVDPNLCWIADNNGHQDGLYGITDTRSHLGTCEDHVVLPLSYAGSCGSSGTGTSLGNGGCRSPYTCADATQCAPGRACNDVPDSVVNNSGATACTCNNDADCSTNLPVDSAGRQHVGYTCQSGFCIYTQDACRGDSAVMIVSPIQPSPSSILLWMNQSEDYNSTSGFEMPFSSAATPVPTINVVDPELRAQGLTPLGGSLRSAATWYNGIKTAGSDGQLACRPYITVLLTDGVDTCEGNGTQDEWGPPAAARKFVAETVTNARVRNKVYVVGLSVTDTSDRDRLNAVAYAGGTTNAKFVSSSAEIEAALADILAESILFERCNGVDDDCDGLIDEGFGVYEECVPTTTRAQGTPATTFTCLTSGRWQCANTTQCSAGYACTGGFCVATCTAGLGPCQATGVRACQVNGTAACNATPLAAPGAESTFGCNNRDDDCDGYIDDCTDASPNTCSCGGCTGQPEICNGLDDDCVSGADNNPVDVGLPCGVGACVGTTVCSNAGTSSALLTCSGGTGSDELCNNVDDDCDGVVDNFTEACPPVSGQCDPGVRTCTAGTFGTCTGVVPGGTEVCNGIDDDCDGVPDDSPQDSWLVPTPTACCPTGNAADCCTLGAYQCVDGMQTCVGATIKGTEVCDGVDNDCNSMIDDVAGIGQACTSGSVTTGGTCTAEYVCTGTPGTGPLGLTCTQVVGPTGEVCNGEDDDCDGTADNNITSTTDPRVGVEGGAPCMALPDGQTALPCMPGVTACEAGQIICTGYVGPQANLCDGISRDCTGMPNTNGDCPAGFECYQGNCVTPCGMGEFPCQGGFVCDPVTRLCIPDVCNKANCPPGQICELADDGSAVCKDPCENITCPEGATCTNGVCASSSCKENGCPTGQICQGTPAACVDDPCATKICETNEYCNVAGECERICENVCLSGTVCIDGTCQNDPCAGKNCPAGEVCVLSGGNGVCVESFCGNECGTSGRVCCGGSCRPDPCSKLQCPVNTQCQLDPACGPQCVAGAGSDPVQIVGAGGGGIGCATAGTDLQSGAGALLLLAAALAIARRNRRLALVKIQRSLR